MKSKTIETPGKIEFRWRQHQDEYAERLAQLARDSGRTASDQARELLIHALTNEDRMEYAIETLRQELSQVLAQLQELSRIKEGLRVIHENLYEARDELITGIAKLLVDAGRLSPQDAEEWIKKSFTSG